MGPSIHLRQSPTLGPMRICHVALYDTCYGIKAISVWHEAAGDPWTNITRVNCWHVAYEEGFITVTNQSAFDTWHMAGMHMPCVKWKLPETSRKSSNSYGHQKWAVRSKLIPRGQSDQNMPCVNVPRVNVFLPHKWYKPIGVWHVACNATTWRGHWLCYWPVPLRIRFVLLKAKFVNLTTNVPQLKT
jgi:hypothetical protein